jgi:pimeloyl-ACP methyl ester carboxylesterase
MPTANIDGIQTHYLMQGNGPPLLMLAPAGFDSSISRWSASGVWKLMRPLDTLAADFTLIAYDRREAGESGGRIEPLTWRSYTQHARALLDHLNIEKALVLGGCMGCSVASAFAADFPERCSAQLLHWPVGGFRWMQKGRTNFQRHIEFARVHGLAGVAERARQSKVFWGDPEAGPWSSVIATDPAFAAAFVRQDLESYLAIVARSRDALFNDTMPSGATGEQLLAMTMPAFIMPGDDASHATSCAHALRELIPQAHMSLLMPPQQTPEAVAQWIRDAGNAVRSGSARVEQQA